MLRRAAISSMLAAQIGAVGVPVAAFAAEKYKEAGENMAGYTTAVKEKPISKEDQQKLADKLFNDYGNISTTPQKDYLDFIKAYKIKDEIQFNQVLDTLGGIQKLDSLGEFAKAKILLQSQAQKTPAVKPGALAKAKEPERKAAEAKQIIPAKKEAMVPEKETAEKAVVSPKKVLANAAEGETIWTTEYYPSVKASSSSLQFSSAYSNATALPQDAAAALLSYSNTANECGVAGPEEKKTISTTAVMLYGADPSLLTKYLEAAENLAELCRNQPNEYRKALDLLTVMIDTKTSSIYSANVPEQLPVQKTARQISNALNEIIDLKAGDMYKLNRLSLMDRNVYISGYPPYSIQQRASGWESSLLEGNRESAGLYQSTYMFPYRLNLPTNMPYSRSMVGTDIRGGGTVMFPNIPLNYQVQPQPELVGTSFKYYLYPEVRASGAHGSLPVTPIAPIGLAGLSDKIRSAFVQAEAPGYDLKARGGGAYGLASKEAGGGLVGSLATKEGGAAAGLGIAPGGDIDFAGLNMVAIPLVTGKAAEPTPITVNPSTIISASGNSEFWGAVKDSYKKNYKIKTAVSDEQLSKKLKTTYDNQKDPSNAAFWKDIGGIAKEKNMGQMEIPKAQAPVLAAIEDFTTGWEKMDDGTKRALLQSIGSIYDEKNPKDIVLLASSSANETGEWSAGRGYLITKKGDVFELAGGADTFNKLLNYIASYGNENSLAVPTTYAWNVENKLHKGGAVLAMDLGNVPVLFQFQDVPAYISSGQKLVTWTAAGGTTFVPKQGQANIHEISLPGTLYRISKGEITSQHVNYSMRHIEEEKRWEFDAGGTAGKSTLGRENKAFQGAGFLMKWEEGKMNERMAQRGFGVTTQRLGGDALALAGNESAYVGSLYRISETLYGTNSPAASDMMFGGLIHLVEQLKGEFGNDRYDATLFRLVGFFSGLKDHGMLDVTRASWVDRMLGDFDDLKRNAGQNPQNLESLISQFQNNYLGNAKTLIDDYYMGVQVNGNGSLEFSMQTRETGGNWARQMVDRGAGRMLYTWNGGFVRGYAMIPVMEAIAPMEGIVGAGSGFDLFHSVWLPRLAFDAGIMTLTQRQTVTGFGQAAVTAYDNILEDASAYRKLVSESNLAKEGKFSELSKKEREAIASNVKTSEKNKASQDLKDATAALEEGRNLKDASAMPVGISQAIDSWFAKEKADVQKRFNGHTLIYSGASLYGLGNGQFYGDIGAFMEYADRLKSYIIVASRKDVTVYGGAEYSFDRDYSLGVIVGANKKKLSGGISLSMKAGPGILSSYGILTNGIMPYTPPYTRPYGFFTANDWVFGIIWTFGEGAFKPAQAPRIEPNEGLGRAQH